MQNGRWYPTLTTMANGQILAISGGDTAAALNRIPELFHPGQNTWRALPGAARDVPYYPMMFLAPDGKVFLAGPEQSTAFLDTSGAGGWTTGPTRRFGYRDYGSAVMYDAGKILVVGGGAPTASAEMIDLLGTRVWDFAGVMSIARRQINATLLADGTVLVTGGTNASGFNSAPTSSEVLAAEQWDPASPGTWKKLAQHEPLPALPHDRAPAARRPCPGGRERRAGGDRSLRRPDRGDLLSALPVQRRRHAGDPAGDLQRSCDARPTERGSPSRRPARPRSRR